MLRIFGGPAGVFFIFIVLFGDVSGIMQRSGRISQRPSGVSSFRKIEGHSFSVWSARARGVTVSTGKVKWFNGKKGFGFIVPDEGGEELFVHHSEIKMGGYADLQEGQAVSYDVGQGKKGPCAVNVVPK
jgi:CspA family cold shock protein